VLACAIAALVYQNALDAPFIFDDRVTVLLNPTITGSWDLAAILTRNVARPMVNLSYAIDEALWGISSFGLHVTNVVLHIVAVALFYGWCTRALNDARSIGARRGRRGEAGGATPEWPAFVAASILAVHPLMSSAVMYVTGRSELLAAIGAFACLIFARRAIVAGGRVSGVIAFICGAMAIGSSSSAAVLPFLVLAYDAWVLRGEGLWRRSARYYSPACFAVLTAAAVRTAGILAAGGFPPRGFFGNLALQGVVLFRYLGLFLLPRGQSLVHDTSGYHPAVGVVLLGAAAALVVLAVRRRYARPLIAFGACWFLGVLAPTTFVPVRDAIAEQRMYLAGAGLLLAAASYLSTPLSGRVWARALAACVIVALGAQTYVRNQVWLDPLSLWQATVERSPGSWVAHRELAEVLREAGMCEAARAELQLARDLNPGLAEMAGFGARCEAPK
jgi:protein O-mannosyl-transferase